MKRAYLAIVAVCVAAACAGVENHADGIIARILENAAKIKAVRPQAVPMAFWDFDGTIIKGDISEGCDVVDGKVVMLYKGLIQKTIEAGLNSVYPPKGGWEQDWEKD